MHELTFLIRISRSTIDWTVASAQLSMEGRIIRYIIKTKSHKNGSGVNILRSPNTNQHILVDVLTSNGGIQILPHGPSPLVPFGLSGHCAYVSTKKFTG